MTKDIEHRVIFPSLLSKPLHVAFDEPLTSSGNGSILLKSVDESMGLTDNLLADVSDSRQSGKVQHSHLDLLRQRVFGIATGYADANEVARLGDDPLHKLLLARDLVTGASLASQPTISRFENGLGVADHYRLGKSLAETVIDWHRNRLRRQKVKRITCSGAPSHGCAHLFPRPGFGSGWTAGFLAREFLNILKKKTSSTSWESPETWSCSAV